MSESRTMNVKDYYRQITDQDIGQVARELLKTRITQESERLLQCDCPHHASQSHRSLHVMLDKQGWYCFGCGVGGDVLQLVEFIQSGVVTSKQNGSMPDTHRAARDFLADRSGMPSLASFGLTKEQIAETETTRSFNLRVQEALTALAGHYHAALKDNPEVLAWLTTRYAISEDVIDQLQIGYADPEAHIVRTMTSGDVPFTLRELAATGAFLPTSQDSLNPFYRGRIVFPYWRGGRVAFMIGRKTPWTPDAAWEQGKYKKLPVHNERDRRHIASCIDNGILFNEDVLLTRPERLIITEGVTDCIALMERGFPALSPVTVRIRKEDWERIVPRLRGIDKVYVCQDNELSEAGLKGALQTARILSKHQIETRIVALPLSEEHLSARQQLSERFGIEAHIGARTLRKQLAERSEQEINEAEALLAQSKIDINDFFLNRHSPEEFEQLLDQAVTPIEFSIDNLDDDLSDSDLTRHLEPILREVAGQSPLEQNRLLKRIQEHVGSSVTLGALRQQISAVQKQLRQEYRREKKKAKRASGAPPGSCRARVEEVLIETELEQGYPDYTRVAEAAYEWFTLNGAMFFHTRSGDPFLFFDDAIFWMDSGDRGRKRRYASLIYKHTGLVATSTGGRTFFEVLANLALMHGQVREHFSWLHTDTLNHTIYFNLNNERQEIAKITPEGVEILKNGGNADGIILESSNKMLPVEYDPDADPDEADRLLVDHVSNTLACPASDRFLVLSWLSSFLLFDFAGTRPMTRFEGPAGSGKTTASKLISALIYGRPEHKKATDAANYSDGSQNPLIVLDNIETKQMTEELTTFMLTSITGIAREKRKAGTDTEVISERTRCLLNTTGIEPLMGELAEIQSRSFVINFSKSEQDNTFIESEAITEVQRHRNTILSGWMKRTSLVLAMIRDGLRSQAMLCIHGTLGDHDKRRCNEYLSLMYLMMLAGSSQQEINDALNELDSRFEMQIQSLNSTSRVTAREANPISTVLAALFSSWEQAKAADERDYHLQGRANHISDFIQRYQLELDDDHRLANVLSRQLFIALKRLAKDFNLAFPYESARQFAQRLANDLETIQEAGFIIQIDTDRKSRKLYTIKEQS